MKIHLTVDLPDALGPEFLQHLRDFDTRHDPEHKDIVKISTLLESEVPMTAEQAVAVLERITPRPQHLFIRKLD